MVEQVMFVSCLHCQSLVAVDVATGAAPEHCPYCDIAITAVPAEPDTDAKADTLDVSSADSGLSTSHVVHDPMTEIEGSAGGDYQASELQSVSIAETRDDPGAQTPQPAAQKRRKNVHPSFAKRPVSNAVLTRNARWPWPLAACLMLLLLLQLIVADRVSLAANPRSRVAITKVCNVMRCDIPPWRDAGAFTMLTRDVHAHPGIAGTLRIRASFRNDARWSQPWPQLVVTLSDASGRVTGSRTFTADEYLGNAPTQKLIATGQTAAVALEIREPAPDTVSFSFDFR